MVKPWLLFGVLPLLLSCAQSPVEASSSEAPSSIEETSQETSEGSFSSESSLDPSSSEGDSASSGEGSSFLSEEDPHHEASFYHCFKKSDFPSLNGGEASINGISFAYTSSPYFGQSSEGVQIGSSNRPQKDPFSLSFDLESGAKVLSFSAFIKGNGYSAEASCDGEVFSAKGKASKLEEFSSEGLSGSSFSLSLSASGKAAVYLYSLSLTFWIPDSCSFSPKTDEEEASAVVPGENGIPALDFPEKSEEEYYADVDLSLEGDALREELCRKSAGKKLQKYSSAKTMLPYIEENPSKPGYMRGFYDGDDLLARWDGSWNREHVWACAHLRNEDPNTDVRPGESTRGIGTDLHNLHASCLNANSLHSDKIFSSEAGKETFFPNLDLGFPHKGKGDFRGDVARTVFYMYATYPGLELVASLGDCAYKQMGDKDVLLSWNEIDPVDEAEMQRNERVYGYQGNRNPFVDHPELAAQVLA